MRIAFIHPHKAFLPEIDAYQKFFSTFNVKTIVIKPDEIHQMNADVEWHFMGIDKSEKKEDSIKIHEYTSASISPFGQLKNFSKKILNVKPDYRLFLNEYVQDKFGFDDEIPSGFREMGIANSFLNFDNNKSKKEYDFIYAGSVNAERKIDGLIERFATKYLSDHSLLILSKDYDDLKNKFKQFDNIHFTGPIAHDEMPAHISKAKFAINFMVDKEPFNQQTSTKLLEYAALKMPIITTDYNWIRNFQKENGGDFYYLQKNLSNLTWEKISQFNYSFPDLKEWTWEKQIRKSGVLEFLQTKFRNLSF